MLYLHSYHEAVIEPMPSNHGNMKLSIEHDEMCHVVFIPIIDSFREGSKQVISCYINKSNLVPDKDMFLSVFFLRIHLENRRLLFQCTER